MTYEGIQAGKYPPVHGGQVFAHQLMPGGVEVIYVRIKNVEGVGVPEGSHILALAFGYGLCGEAVGEPGHGAGVEIPAHSVCALIVQKHPGIYHVAYVLAHLAAFLILNVAQHDAVEEGGGIEQAGRYGGKGIEPAAGLVDGLADKVCGVAALKLILVFKGIVPLCEGHGAGIEPAVYDYGLAAHGAAALALPGEGIHIGLMQLNVLIAAGKLRELLTAANDVYLAALVAYPYGQGGAPVALAGDAPVYYVLQEVAHAAFLDGFGDPVDAAVVVYKPVLYLGHGYEPGGTGIVDKRRVAAPAEGVAVLKPGGGKEKAALVQIL